jgi:hypothetical protein
VEHGKPSVRNARRQFGIQETGIGSLVSHAPNRGKPKVDGGRRFGGLCLRAFDFGIGPLDRRRQLHGSSLLRRFRLIAETVSRLDEGQRTALQSPI